MKQLWVVVVFIWYICENEIYLFTRAEYQSSTIPVNIEDIPISCNNSLRLQIRNATILQDYRSCKDHQCLLSIEDINDIKQRCNGANVCNPNVNLTSQCLVEQPIGTYEISYDCKVMCDFERDQCSFPHVVDVDDNGDSLNWTRKKVKIINGISVDHTTGSRNGFIMHVESEVKSRARINIPTIIEKGWICVSFWFIAAGRYYKMNPLILYDGNNKQLQRYSPEQEDEWKKITRSVYTSTDHVIFEADFTSLRVKSILGLDDILISIGTCKDSIITYSQCGYWNANVTIDKCPSIFMSRLQIHFTNIDPSSAEQQNCSFAKRIASHVKKHCIQNYKLDYCDINLSNVVSSSNHTCPVPHKSIHIEYVCKETTTSVAILTQTVSSTSLRDVTTDSLESDSPSSTPVTGIVVGVVLSFVALSVILVIAFIYFRRSRYAEKKGHSIVANEDSHSDYTGHQNTAFSSEVNVTTQTDYCEVRTSKNNDQYHDITDTFSPSINTINDDEYSEIANVVNSPNNPNASTNYQHQYISLDPNATGFDRSNQKTNLHNESKNNHNSNEKTSFMGGDDYAILDPDDNESKNNTPKVLPLSENYVVLDPNETGFNRQENTNTLCNYELSTPINSTVTSEDPYDASKDETYDTSSNSRHKEKENNIYSHMVDNVYDTAGNQRKNEDNDGTYDHFFGQQSEDDYDISKPL